MDSFQRDDLVSAGAVLYVSGRYYRIVAVWGTVDDDGNGFVDIEELKFEEAK